MEGRDEYAQVIVPDTFESSQYRTTSPPTGKGSLATLLPHSKPLVKCRESPRLKKEDDDAIDFDLGGPAKQEAVLQRGYSVVPQTSHQHTSRHQSATYIEHFRKHTSPLDLD